MVKAYLRYEHAGAFGVISSGCNVLYDASGKQLFTGALENIAAWNIRQGSQVASLAPELASSSSSTKAAAEVTQIALGPGSSNQLAAGYSDGTVRIWDVKTQTCLVTLSGHSGAVTALRFSRDGALLASGSADTTLVVWDVVGEAGLCRFKGHKDAVTDLVLVHRGSKLISSSKDGCVKVWDVTLQHCSQTLIGFKGEVWSLDVDPSGTRLVAGCVDSDLRVYAIRSADDVYLQQQQQQQQPGSEEEEEPLPESLLAAAAAAAASGGQQQQRRQHELLVPLGSVRRAGQERVSLIRYSSSGQLLGVMGAGKSLELFSVRGAEDAAKKAKRRLKRKKEKAGVKKAKTGDKSTPGGHEEDAEEGDGDGEGAPTVQASDEVGSLLVMTLKHKLRSFAFSPTHPKGATVQLALGLTNNSVEVVDVKESSYEVSSSLDLPGHRSDVRCLALSSDDLQLLSGSNAGCKLWSPTTGACLGSIETGYALCVAFIPGNRHALVGTKEGTVQLIDVGACSVVHTQQAHSGAVWSLALLPDKSGFVTGSADKTIKFWEWAVTTEQQQQQPGAGADDPTAHPAKKQKKKHKQQGADEDTAAAAAAAAAVGPVVQRLGFQMTRQLEMAEDVLCVKVSPDNKLLAASLLDHTIKVYYIDSLKFFLSLYGHKLPATTLDISSDSSLLISGSADKNIKVWGLDFGDCHKSLFAHQDTVRQVGFVRDTHYAFSVGRDKGVKYWDMDRWELLLDLPGHHGDVQTLAVSQYGDFVVTGSSDRSIRRWERTSEPFFVEEEKERRLESLFEADMEQQQQQGSLVLGPQGGAFTGGAAGAAAGAVGDEGAAAAAGRRTAESVSAADSIMDALDVAAHETDKQAEYQAAVAAAKAASQPLPKAPPSNPLMLGLSAEAYVLRSVGGVRANDLEQALLLLPFADALKLLEWVSAWLAQGNQVELSCRVATLLLRLHHAQLTATSSARQTLVDLHKRMRSAVQDLKDTLGFNIAALRFLQRSAKEAAGVEDGDAVTAARKVLLEGGGGMQLPGMA